MVQIRVTHPMRGCHFEHSEKSRLPAEGSAQGKAAGRFAEIPRKLGMTKAVTRMRHFLNHAEICLRRIAFYQEFFGTE